MDIPSLLDLSTGKLAILIYDKTAAEVPRIMGVRTKRLLLTDLAEPLVRDPKQPPRRLLQPFNGFCIACVCYLNFSILYLNASRN
jgi:hypothetical protein